MSITASQISRRSRSPLRQHRNHAPLPRTQQCQRALSGSLHTDESQADILTVWLETAFAGDRHKRRINKINSHASEVDGTSPFDKVIPLFTNFSNKRISGKKKISN